MKLFLDTEFNGFGGKLMSMGIVADNGRFFYEVIEMDDPVEPWVQEHVVPQLVKKPVSPEVFRSRLHEFLREFSNPTIVVDWYADAVHFFEAFQGRSHAESIEYPCTLELVSLNDVESAIPHNALADATAIRQAYGRAAIRKWPDYKPSYEKYFNQA